MPVKSEFHRRNPMPMMRFASHRRPTRARFSSVGVVPRNMTVLSGRNYIQTQVLPVMLPFGSGTIMPPRGNFVRTNPDTLITSTEAAAKLELCRR